MKKFIISACFLIIYAGINAQNTVNQIFKAKSLASAGRFEPAAEVLTDALNQKKQSILFLERAEIFILEGDYSAAIMDCNEANKIQPNSGDYLLSKIYSLKGDAATSLYHLELNLRSGYKKSEKEIMMDPAFKSLERNADWRKFWRNEWYNSAEKKISEIEYYVSSGKGSDAAEVLSELRKDYQSDENDILYAESLVNLSNGKNQEVIKSLSGKVQSDPSEKLLRLLARAQFNSGNAAGASTTYTEILNLEIADPSILMQRAECYRKTSEFDKALADIEAYLEIYPADNSAISIAGKVSAASGDNIKAMEYFSENLRLHPNDPQAYIDRANSFFISRSWDWAIKDYSMSLDLQPDNSEVWLNKGIALLRSGKVEDACHDFKISYKLGNKKVSEYISANCLK